ncbi:MULTISPECIES: Lrp/AsnC family transcriptional regulator [Pedobacter]|uniref:Lrp/AsnC family transcriptional regulator n=1 Tax=Pedobacter TaxID=84567 RepID=UPI00210EFD45|nr:MULTISPECIES: Lrp/AsnC family transcriptional regulator [unclassified Pedobacter]
MHNHKLDETDFDILRLVQRNALLSYKEIGFKIKRSANAIFERVKRLREEGYIRSTVAMVDYSKLGPVFIAFPHINLTAHSEEAIISFQKTVTAYPEVMECYNLTGHYDFMLKIMMPNMNAYNEFLKTKVANLPNVGSIHSFLVLSEVKKETAYHFL